MNMAMDDDEDASGSRRNSLIAIVVVVVLIGVGLWLSGIMGSASRLQDCMMQGRTNCASFK